MKWRFDLAEIENEKLFNIFKTERVKIENKSFEKTIDISIKITKKLKWKKIETKNEVDCNSDTFTDIFDLPQRSDKKWRIRSSACCESSFNDELDSNFNRNLDNNMRSHIKSIQA